MRAPTSDIALCDLNARWFGVLAPAAYAANGQATAAFLAALDECASPLVLQCDSDVMIARTDRRENWLQPLLDCFARDPAAVTVSLSIAHDAESPFSPGPWRVETRAALLHRERLRRLRPLPNVADRGALDLPWHRALDIVVNNGRATSFRGAHLALCFVHPPNDRKRDPRVWMQILDGVERARLPAGQFGRVDLVAAREDFLPRARHERFVFVITGRNVAPGRMRRCLDSLTSQQRCDWGAVVVDDASDQQTAEYLELWCERHSDRVTLMRPRLRRGQLANLVDAIRVVCTDPEAVILTLDLDDALLGPDVLDHVGG